MLSQTLLNEHNNHPYHWRNNIAKSLLFNIQFKPKSNFVDTARNTLKIYSEIRNVCYHQNYAFCHGTLQGLCGSVEIITDKLMDCVWNLQVPDNLCINVTVDNFPNGDPFINDYFSLSIKDGYTDDNSIHFHHNQDHCSITTNSSQSLVQLKILKLFSISKLKFRFQATVCNEIVSFNSITTIDQDGHIFPDGSKVVVNFISKANDNKTILSIKAVQANVIVRINTLPSYIFVKPNSIFTTNFLPYVQDLRLERTEYHLLLRTYISSYVQIQLPCIREVSLFNGPLSGFLNSTTHAKQRQLTVLQ